MESGSNSPVKRKSNTAQRASVTIRKNFSKGTRNSVIPEDYEDHSDASSSVSPNKSRGGHSRANTTMTGGDGGVRGQTEIVRSSDIDGNVGRKVTNTVSSTMRMSIRNDTTKFR